MIQSYSADYNPDEQWWKRLTRQLSKLPGQSRVDIYYLRLYAFWPWLLVTPLEYTWSLMKWILGHHDGHIRLDEEVPLHGPRPLQAVDADWEGNFDEPERNFSQTRPIASFRLIWSLLWHKFTGSME